MRTIRDHLEARVNYPVKRAAAAARWQHSRTIIMHGPDYLIARPAGAGTGNEGSGIVVAKAGIGTEKKALAGSIPCAYRRSHLHDFILGQLVQCRHLFWVTRRPVRILKSSGKCESLSVRRGKNNCQQ